MGACAKKKRGGFIVVERVCSSPTRLDRLGWEKKTWTATTMKSKTKSKTKKKMKKGSAGYVGKTMSEHRKRKYKKKFSTESQGFGHLYFSVFTFPKNNVSVLLKQNV